ncbi:MAG: hypothetical protein ACK4IK_01980 [Bacteroidia bacterium]
MAKTVSDEKSKISLCLKLRNGNIVTGKSFLTTLNFTTKYGVLNIPINDLIQIDFGIIASEKTKQKIDAFVDLLQTSNEKECKRIFNSLNDVEIGAISVLAQYLESDQCAYPEYGVEAAYNFLKSKYEIEDFITEDIITLAGDYRFPGVSDIEFINLQTEFGELSIPREKIITAEIIPPADANGGKRTYKLEANQHISANANGGWLKTNIHLKKGQKFSIESKGEIILASLSNQAHKPSGSYLPPGGAWTAGNDNDPNAAPIFGNVVYKIGENNAMHKAGTKLNTSAYASGMLYLSIYETVFNTANTGHYTVTVTL